jgi:6-phosphogluconolactonase (cycloisomerase 2 family)
MRLQLPPPEILWRLFMNRYESKMLAAILAACLFATPFVPVASAQQKEVDEGGVDGGPGAVYTMTNDPLANAILAYHRDGSGDLTPRGVFFTSGRGTGGKEPDFALANARALVLSEDGQLLFAVNPGSDDISVFSVSDEGLKLVDRKVSGGHLPISVTVSGNLLYVLNAGGNDGQKDNISGFTVGHDGHLTAIANSTGLLSADTTNPAQIGFNRTGTALVVTERVANNIDTFAVGRDGLATGPVVNPAPVLNPAGPTNPFGFDFDARGGLFVSDDFNDAAGLGALSSFRLTDSGVLQPVSQNVQAGQSGACWVGVSRNSRFAYLVNAVSSAISVYSIDPTTEKVDLLGSVPSPTNPTDIGFSLDGRFLYALNPDETGNAPGITAYRVDPKTGSLTPLPGITDLPNTVDGLAVR